MADFITMSLSGGTDAGGLVKSMEVHFDESVVEPAVRWRLLQGARGWVDVYAGVRYANLYQSAELQPNSPQIQAASTALVDAVGDRLRAGMSDGQLSQLIDQQVTPGVASLQKGIATLPAGPVAGSEPGRIRDRIRDIIEQRKAELIQAIQAGAQDRIDAIKHDLNQQIAGTLESALDSSTSRVDDWWDPFIGVRARLNLSRAWYLIGRSDVGGFGVGSQFAWQVEAAVGYQITSNLFVEAGYRALSMDYRGSGLVYDVLAHGATVTIGLRF